MFVFAPETFMKINCEEKGPGTSLQQRFMSRVQKQERATPMRCLLIGDSEFSRRV